LHHLASTHPIDLSFPAKPSTGPLLVVGVNNRNQHKPNEALSSRRFILGADQQRQLSARTLIGLARENC
jgi:hypothetical protein